MGKRIFEMTFVEAMEAVMDGMMVQGKKDKNGSFLMLVKDPVFQPYVGQYKISDAGRVTFIGDFTVTESALQQMYRIVPRATKDCLV